MTQPSFENLKTLMYPSGLLHQFGVNGKISGSVFAAGEIEGAIPLIHGPCGCGFHYRYSARRRHYPLFQLVASNVSEKDIIFGGEATLFQAIVRIARDYDPPLIIVIPSPVSDIVQDDIQAVVIRARVERGINVIAADSEVFSHRDKRYGARRLKELAQQKMDQAKPLNFDIRGCGYTEVLCALVNDVMESRPVSPLTVNIETIAWGVRGKQEIREIESTLAKAGVKLHAYFPSTTVKKIRSMPKAALNIAKRIRWANQMEQLFGTPYIGLNNTQRYSGLEGALLFYREVGRALGIEQTIEAVAREECNKALEKTRTAREAIKKARVILVADIQLMPYQIKKYSQDFGTTIVHAVALVTDRARKDLGITERMIHSLEGRIQEARKRYSVKTSVHLNPSRKKVQTLAKECDGIVGTQDPWFASLGLALVHPEQDDFFLSFKSYVQSVEQVSNTLLAGTTHSDLWLNKMGFNQEDGLILPKKNILATRQMWSRMWIHRTD